MTAKFMTEDEIVDDWIAQMSPIDKHTLKDMRKEELIGLHHGTGTAIRNHYLLWNPDNPFTDNSDAMGEKFADQVSQRIIERAWGRLQHG
jgi:hypothetical protein